jgi:hypothetical protein
VNSHPSDAELRGFVRHTLAAEQVIAIDDHLVVCDACRARASAIGRAGAKLVELAADVLVVEAHLTDEQLQQYVGNEIPAEGRERLARHLAECEMCGLAVNDLQHWSAASPRPRQRVYLAAAAAAVLLLLSPFAISRWFSGDAVRETASVAGLELLSSDQQEQVMEALRAGVAEPPSILTDMMTGSEVLMGTAGTQPFRLTAPLMTVTVTDRPTFRWDALPGADDYVIAVLDAGLRPVAGPITLSATTWTPSEPLARGGSYVWQVSARRGTTSVTVPAPPAPLARFSVMDAANASSVERVLRIAPDAHLLLGLVLAQAGARQEAAVHLRQVPADDPYGHVARRTLERLDRGRSELN